MRRSSLLLLLACAHASSDGDDLSLTEGNWSVVEDDAHVWLVKFYSPKCGGCQEFAPTWEAAHGHAKAEGLHWAVVNIDEKAGLSVAQRLNVLEEGIPNVKLFNAIDDPYGFPIVIGTTPTLDQFLRQLTYALNGSSSRKDASGYYARGGHSDEL